MIVDRKELPEEFDITALDTDVVLYRASFAAQHTNWTLYDSEGNHVEAFSSAKDADNHLQELSEFFGEDTTGYYRKSELVVADEQTALDAADTILKHIYKKIPSKQYKLYLTGKGNYREQISVSAVYKGNRKNTEKPVHYEAVKQHLIKNHGAVVVNGAEADDCLGVVMYAGHLGKKVTCSTSIDKDITNVPGIFYDFVKDEWHKISEEEADAFLWAQILQGDRVDNIAGLESISKEFRAKYKLPNYKGVGPATAKAILKDCNNNQERFDMAKEAFQSCYGEDWRDRLQEAGKLVYIQREKGKIWDASWYE